jgi:Bacterial PH domain/Short C-terminal domain
LSRENDSGELHVSKDFDSKEIDQIQKIKHRLDNDEKVELIARQSKHRPGGSITGRDTIFVTTKRIIIRDPSLLGARENVVSVSYDKITSIELEKGVFSSKVVIRAPGFAEDMESIPKKLAEEIVEYVKRSMEKLKIDAQKKQSIEIKESLADELLKLADLKEKGVLSNDEFLKMKQDLLNKTKEQ